ncbi:hypothetical protein ACFQ07_03450, partial [Actinomadura adrarensis]
EALRHPASFLYVARGILGLPALAGRTDPMREGERGRSLLLLFHVVPFARYTIHVVELDASTRTIRTREHGGIIKSWKHTLHAEPAGEGRCRYSDTVEIDAGVFTPIIAVVGIGIYRYRHLRWRRLVRKHLMAEGPRYAVNAEAA